MFRLLGQPTQQVAKSGIMCVKRATALKLPVRGYADDDCKPDVCEAPPPEETRCGSPSLRQPCGVKPEKKEKPREISKPDKPFKSMWEVEGCPPIYCEFPNARYDVKYYRISDKEKRKYQVTWNDCPRMVVKPRKVCLYESIVRPKPCRRKRQTIPVPKEALKLQDPMPCPKNRKDDKCIRVTMPCCKNARIPPTCLIVRAPAKCKKPRAPYPSFSECKKADLLEYPPIECKCLERLTQCEAWAVLRRRLSQGKGPFKTCGEV